VSGRGEKLIADFDQGVERQQVGAPWPVKRPSLREIEHHRLVWKTEVGKHAAVSGATASACGPDVHNLRVGIPVVNVSEHHDTLLVDEHAMSDGEVSGQIASQSCLSGQKRPDSAAGTSADVRYPEQYSLMRRAVKMTAMPDAKTRLAGIVLTRRQSARSRRIGPGMRSAAVVSLTSPTSSQNHPSGSEGAGVG
jgi:hypothetical protein